ISLIFQLQKRIHQYLEENLLKLAGKDMLSRLMKLAISKENITLVDVNNKFGYLVALMFKQKNFKL
ncbi:hypothetical protein H311_02481, partial [Anncaliia algerae PRA109]